MEGFCQVCVADQPYCGAMGGCIYLACYAREIESAQPMRLGGVISRDLSICGHGIYSHWSGLLCIAASIGDEL